MVGLCSKTGIDRKCARGLLSHFHVIEIYEGTRQGNFLFIHSVCKGRHVYFLDSISVQGDQRAHSHVVALRAVTSQDGMTADWYNSEHKFLDDVSRETCNKVRGVNRVVQHITSKPPSTNEWE